MIWIALVYVLVVFIVWGALEERGNDNSEWALIWPLIPFFLFGSWLGRKP